MPETHESRQLIIGLNAFRTLGRGVLCRLAEEVDRWRDARGTAVQEEALRRGIPVAELRRALALVGAAYREADQEQARAERAGCAIVVRGDDAYPQRLLDLPLPPALLFVRGTIPRGPAVAVVGARKMDAYGAEAARYFAHGLAAAGLPIISGFAIGIDRVGHRAALDAGHAGGAGTVAVVGCGLDVDYPRNSRALAAEIAEHGAVISEFALGSEPRPWHFPVRNRIIAALAVGTLVVQAKARSGALNTARHALEINRDIYAVPGRIFEELSLGPNALISDGALAARRIDDVLGSLSMGQQQLLFEARASDSDTSDADTSDAGTSTPSPTTRSTKPASTGIKGLPGRIVRALDAETDTAEDLAAVTGQSIDRVLGALLELELMGHVVRQPGPRYVPSGR